MNPESVDNFLDIEDLKVAILTLSPWLYIGLEHLVGLQNRLAALDFSL